MLYGAELILLGLASGLLAGLFGVGGGVVIVPVLTVFFKLDIKDAIGTSLAVIVPTAVMGSYTHWRHGNVRLFEAGLVAAGAVVSAVIGASITAQLSSQTLKRLFALLLIVMAVRMILDTRVPGR